MSEPVSNVLFLCTGNSARSVLAESILNEAGGRFRGFSAGSFPTGRVNPFAIGLLEARGYPISDLHSKSWDEFAADGAPDLDFIFTVCDNAAGEACPIWPGQPVSAHWGIADPAAVEGTDDEKSAAFERAYDALDARIKRFLALPFGDLEPEALIKELAAIGLSNKGEKSGV